MDSFVCLNAGFAGAAFCGKCYYSESKRYFGSSRFFFLSVSYSTFSLFLGLSTFQKSRMNLAINYVSNISFSLSLCLSGKLQVIYPELVIDKCSVIPKDLRKKISTVWRAPQIVFTEANKVRSVLVYFIYLFLSPSTILNKF